MNTMTVTRRIVFGFSGLLVLVAAIAAIRSYALSTTTSTYERALAQRRVEYVPALNVLIDTRGANMAYLKFLLEGQQADLVVRDSVMRLAYAELRTIQDSAEVQNREAWAGVEAIVRH